MRSMVEGHAVSGVTLPRALPTHLDNSSHRQRQITQHHLRWNPQCGDTLRPQEMPPRCIGLLRARIVVRPAIDLDRQPRRRAVKVQDIGSSGMLAADFQTTGPLTQFTPEDAFGQRHLTAQLASAFHYFARSGDYCLCPSTTFGGPPPRFGEE